jgi:hypothetical protein
VDWLQEVVGIDLGNLLWAFARAEGDAVEPMRDVLAEWLHVNQDGRHRAVKEVQLSAGKVEWFQWQVVDVFVNSVRIEVEKGVRINPHQLANANPSLKGSFVTWEYFSRAPSGGIDLWGRKYKGGQFVPRSAVFVHNA